MTNSIVTTNQAANSIKEMFERDDIKAKFREVLGKQAVIYLATVMRLVSKNEYLQSCDPNTLYMGALQLATIGLSPDENLGWVYIIPYKNKAQIQIGWKGFVQLALNTGLYKTISSAAIYPGQMVKNDPLSGYEFNFAVPPRGKPIGYAAFFKLLNGFEKTIYMTTQELTQHGQRYSQSMQKGYGMWKDNFDAMAQKTVIKQLLSKFAPLSLEMQRAIAIDQGVVTDAENQEVEYVDRPDNQNDMQKVNDPNVVMKKKIVKELIRLGYEDLNSPDSVIQTITNVTKMNPQDLGELPKILDALEKMPTPEKKPKVDGNLEKPAAAAPNPAPGAEIKPEPEHQLKSPEEAAQTEAHEKAIDAETAAGAAAFDRALAEKATPATIHQIKLFLEQKKLIARDDIERQLNYLEEVHQIFVERMEDMTREEGKVVFEKLVATKVN